MMVLFSVLFISLLSVHLLVSTINQTLMHQINHLSEFCFCHKEILRPESKIMLQSYDIIQKIIPSLY